ncbi:MAG TPA: alpha/beta hydrolase fold domain-containing protein, partial [Gemmataceae bacterium]|nr:alpha/beta hydrolase fold domain-containing protein [Gemmataceae bacterium]
MTRRGPLVGYLSLAFLLATGLSAPAADPPKAAAVGDKVPNSNSLRDLRGNRRALHDFKGHKAVVIAFVGADCPISNLYLPGLVALEKKYRAKEVQFLAVYANEQEDLDQVAGHAYDRDVPFPVLKDFGQKFADLLGVTRVPTVVVLDGEFVLRYRGRIDDRYGVASRRDKATRDDLGLAVEEVLAGKKLGVAETEADGCLLDRGQKKADKTGVTYTKDVAAILQQRCQGCHRPSQAAPFSLLTYDDAAKHGAMLREVTSQRRMPPWHADSRYGHFRNDRRMTRAEIETLAAWVDGGMPKGDDKDLPKPVAWPEGWTMGKPDQVFEMPEAFDVPATGVVPYKNWVIDTTFTEDRWVQAAECRPGAPGVVHHMVAYILKGSGRGGPLGVDGSMSVLVGWAPGDLGLSCPPDTALRVPKGARLRLEMHYTPNGTAVKDRSAIGITFAPKPPKYELLMSEFANMGIAVPPHDPHYRAEATFRLPADARVLSFVPHMHWRGKDYFYEVIYPDGKKETLLSVPRWDFNWQSAYRLKEPLKLQKGAKLHAVAHWDNSANNPLNPAPDKTVYFGLQSWEEMMVGWVSYVWERPETAAALAKNPPRPSDLMFDRLDVNGDDVITPDEIPERLRPLLLVGGIKLPEKMTREEFAKLFEQMRGRLGPRKPREEEKKPADGEKKPEGQGLTLYEAEKRAADKEEKGAAEVKVGGNFEVKEVKDIAYYEGDDADPKKHKLDLFLPKGQKDFPVLIFVHGGAWVFGDRKMYGSLGNTFAKNGIGTVVISYRLTPQVQHPGHIEDVARAFAWTHENIGKYGGKADQIFVSGQSAGGHLTALLATNETYLKAHKLSLKDIKGAIPISGVYTIVP